MDEERPKRASFAGTTGRAIIAALLVGYLSSSSCYYHHGDDDCHHHDGNKHCHNGDHHLTSPSGDDSADRIGSVSLHAYRMLRYRVERHLTLGGLPTLVLVDIEGPSLIEILGSSNYGHPELERFTGLVLAASNDALATAYDRASLHLRGIDESRGTQRVVYEQVHVTPSGERLRVPGAQLVVELDQRGHVRRIEDSRLPAKR